MLVLPSGRTLRDYTHGIKSGLGFSVDVDKRLCEQSQLDRCPEYQKYVCLLYDEVKVREGLLYDKHSFRMIGFVDVGDINNQSCSRQRGSKQWLQILCFLLWCKACFWI